MSLLPAIHYSSPRLLSMRVEWFDATADSVRSTAQTGVTMMGYFSNGTEGEMYREAYCDRCKWDKDQKCPIWSAHLLRNYDECNNPHSILHMLIPREKAPNFGNKECFFFEPEPSMGLPFDSSGEPK